MTMTRAEIKARLLEFADFLDKLAVHKFNHGSWFEPDFTCKSSACTAGWAAILYRSTAKRYVDKTHEIQKLYSKLDELDPSSKDDSKDIKTINKQICKLERNHEEPDWGTLGQNALGLDNPTANVLFCPSHNFWKSAPKKERDVYVGPKVMALTIRYLAYMPLNRFSFYSVSQLYIPEHERYNEKRMLEFIAEQQALEAKSVNLVN